MKIEFDPRILTEIIGKGQYTQFRSVIAEYVANAWDAEASEVRIQLPEDFSQDPVTVVDNGRGLQKADKFARVGYNVQLEAPITPTYRRKVMGNKGIGRFAGFALAGRITYLSQDGNMQIGITFDRADLLRHDTVASIDVPVTEREVNNGPSGTTVTLGDLDQKYTIPSESQVIRDLLIDFGPASDFRIFVNDHECQLADIEGEVLQIDETSEVFGHISGNLRFANFKSKKLVPGIILRVRNRRVEGPSFFGIDEMYSTRTTNRVYGDLNADGLQDIISSGREAFIQHDERYQQLLVFVKGKLQELISRFEPKGDEDVEEIIHNLPRFKAYLAKMPPHLQAVSNKYIKKIAPKLKHISKDTALLEVIAILVLRASENADFYLVLNELERTENTDIAALAKVLAHWGFGEVANASLMIQKRITILRSFAEIVHRKDALELQELHRVLETNSWIIEDRYSLFTSNKGLRNVLRKIGQKYAGSRAKDRPDLILKRDRDDFLLIELKAPSVIVTMVEVSQGLGYRTEILRNYPKAREMDVYIVGKEYDETSLKTFRPGNEQRVHLMSLDQMLQDAEDRLKWLNESFLEEYEELKEEFPATEMLAELK